MKTLICPTILSLMLAFTVSCKDETTADAPMDRNEDGNSQLQVIDSTEEDNRSNVFESADGAQGGNSTGSVSPTSTEEGNLTGSTPSTSVNRPDKKQTGTTEPDKVAGQFSAPDGTDAENKDGDYYTRNDKTPMPTGSIK